MAVLDPQSDTVVLRVVYDGPPMSGKSTSVKMLADRLGGNVVVPEEIAGRTLFFDWLDYTGGLFEGRQIRCQIISVPGQATLASRRRRLLESADVVVFVGDSTADAQASVRSYLEGLRAVLANIEGPPVGIVFQANKRDDVSAVPIAEMRQVLGTADLRIAIIESIAIEGAGIREAFVFAVRLALDRVREMMRVGRLPTARPKIDSADDLMSELSQVEGNALELAAESGLVHRRLSDLQTMPAATAALQNVIENETAASSAPTLAPLPSALRLTRSGNERPPIPPCSDLPSGMIWPPVNGRLLLHEATANRVHVARDVNGDWSGTSGNMWTIQTPAFAQFQSLQEAREALVSWARLHAASAHIISDRRCIVLAQNEKGQYHLWQIIKIESSLRDEFESALPKGSAAIANAMLRLTDGMLEAAQRWSEAACRLPLSSRKIGMNENGPQYLGQMPYPITPRPSGCHSDSMAMDILAMELRFARRKLASSREEILRVIDAAIENGRDDRAGSPAFFARHFLKSL